MKLLVGRLLLGCILAVLVLADDPVVEVTENVNSTLEVAVTSAPTVVPEKVELDIKTKTFTKTVEPEIEEHEIIIIPDKSVQRPPQDDDDDGHHHHHHHPPPPRPPPHHHRPPPPHPHYPPYYPPYYPPPYPYPYGPQVYQPVPQPYPYYPPPTFIPAPMKPVVVTVADTGSSQNYVKPTEILHQSTGHLWNFIDQKNSELWNLFGNKHGSDDGDDDTIHEVVVINKPITSTGSLSGSSSGSSGKPTIGWFNKGKNFVANDCNNKQ